MNLLIDSNISKIYYHVKPFIPRQLQLWLRRRVAIRKLKSCEDIWPIDREAGKIPVGWQGWPGNKHFALVLTHDVESTRGQDKCSKLMRLERQLGFRSSFNFVAEEYRVSHKLRGDLVAAGFEVGLHGLCHDRKLYLSQEVFRQFAPKINHYLKEWQAFGFRSPCMFHNLDWIRELDIMYDASTFDTDPFEPQPDGVGTVFPFYVSGNANRKGYLELPYTLPQDFTLFILLQQRTIETWKRKLDWLAERGGMALLNVHPDYINFGDKKLRYDEYPIAYYEEFLQYVNKRYKNSYWHVLPKELAQYWAEQYGQNRYEVSAHPVSMAEARAVLL